MKKIWLFFTAISFWLIGMGALQANTPVRGYQLSSTEILPARPEDGWTWFRLRTATEESENDTVTMDGKYLTTGGDALVLPTYQDPINVISEAIGFDFPYAGKTMTRFGLTGDGMVFLGTGKNAEGPSDSIPLRYSPGSLNECDTNIILAMSKLLTWGFPFKNLSVMSDGNTRIGFKAEAEALTMTFENILLVYNAEPTPPGVTTMFRWTYDVILQKNGNISFRFVDINLPEEGVAEVFGFLYALRATAAERPLYAADWKGAVNDGGSVILPVSEDEKNATLTFTYPQACQAPAGITATVTYTQQLATSLNMSLQPEGNYDGLLVFFADRNDVSEHPENGSEYKTADYFNPADRIGDFPVLIYGSTGTNLTLKDLEADKAYYVYIYPYNDRCDGGPLYQNTPTIVEVKTLPAPPAVEVSAVGETSVSLKFSGTDIGKNILIGVARRDYGVPNRNLVLEKKHVVGDTLYYNPSSGLDNYSNSGPYLITACYTGVAEASLVLDNLETGTPYYFYVWTQTAADRYTPEYTPVSAYTIGRTPLTFDFSQTRAPIAGEQPFLPAGWSQSDEMTLAFKSGIINISGLPLTGNIDRLRSLIAMLSSFGGSTLEGDAISPKFIAGYSSLDVIYRMQMVSSSFMGYSLTQFGQEDTLSLWYRIGNESEWNLTATITSQTELLYDANNFATLKTRIEVPVDETVQLRLMLKGPNSDKMLAINSIEIESGLPCAYPEDIRVNDPLTTHRTLALDWTDENKPAASSVLYRYREAGSEEWSEIFRADRQNGCTIKALNQHTTYEIGLRAICRTGDSSLVKITTGSTLYGLPYSRNLTNVTELPEGFTTGRGNLPAEGNVELQVPGSFGPEPNFDGGPTAIGTSVITYSEALWLTFPPICLETITAPAQYSFKYKAYTLDFLEDKNLATESEARIIVLVSPDASFNASEIIDTIKVKELSTEYEVYSIDLSEYTDQIHIALAVLDNPDQDYMIEGSTYFIIDSIKAAYTGDVPCLGVENINQYGLSKTGISLSWTGYGVEYGIYVENTTTNTIDTIYTDQTEYTLRDLDPGTLYLYRIQSFCEEGHRSPGAPSEEGFFNTHDICPVPTNFRIVRTTWQSITFTAHSSSPKIVYLRAKDSVKYNFRDIFIASEANDTVTISGLHEYINIPYLISVRSFCSPGDSSAWTETLEVTTDYPVCGTPTNLQSKTTPTKAELNWTAGTNNSYYWLMFRQADARKLDTVAVYKTDYILSDLKPNTAYVWQLTGICDAMLIGGTAKSEFTTQSVGNEKPETSRFFVSQDNGRISIRNTGMRSVDRVEVFSITGNQLYGKDFHTTDHILLPVLGGQSQMVVVRIFSGNEISIHKVVLL